ncbi:hypothetical protein QR680_014741 [Steinernema hermaphroditum]|uniref:C-type lectin domain-containing protein n=1 Tax=Steinernema hermaphroditum TaxID=289476 RepID=A0AA39M4S6_9BILA|nr:hypothetical protein QR680_014741 [Steinernema hermaphroditum]
MNNGATYLRFARVQGPVSSNILMGLMIWRYVLFSFLTLSALLAENASNSIVQNSDFWYVINPNHLSFEEAEQYCILLKGHLASIHSVSEQKLVKQLIKLHGFNKYYAARLGAVRLPNTTTFAWTDQSAWDFDDWQRTEPSVAEGEDTVTMFFGGWVAIDREENLISVCKVPASALRKAMKKLINND